jgi:anti-sigma regulatory factor (Ser/Thr protein kinase)
VRVCVRRYEATAAAVGHARRRAGALARRWGLGEEVAEAVELVVSELVTNSVQATVSATATASATASTTATATATASATASAAAGADADGGGEAGREAVAVRLAAAGGNLLVEVWDRSEAPPAPADPDLELGLDAEGGRGLLLVAACAARWSYYRPRSGGKVVWAEIALPPPDPAVPVAHPADPALLSRVADGLRALDDWTVPPSPAGGGASP